MKWADMSGFDQDMHVGTTTSLPALPIHGATSGRAESQTSALRGLRVSSWLAMMPVMALAAFLNFYQLSREGYGNTYYAAAVKSMLQSWHNFFFVSFDPGGYVTVDKPPLGFWIQTASAKIFGFHGWSLILPEALAGVASVALLFHLVRRVYGDVAGIVAALVLAVTPVAVSSNRSNIVDSLLVFTLLLGVWALIRATESGQFRWFALSMLFVGLGFNIKMMQAYLVIPAFFAVYFFGAKLGWRTKIWHSGVAVVILLIISLSWATAVDLTPASQRPYVGSSQNNSELNLILGYNGIERLLPRNWSIFGIHGIGIGSSHSQPTQTSTTQAPNTSAQSAPANNPGGAGGGPGGVSENGQAGIFRLINSQLGGEAGWLLPLALIGLIAGAWQVRLRLPLERRHWHLLLWGGWLLTGAIFFSVAGFFHQYYLIMLAPPIAALSGAGIVALWHDFRERKWFGWLLPVALIAVAAVQVHLLAPYASYSHWLSPAIAILCIVAALGLIISRVLPRIRLSRLSLVAVTIGMLGLLLAPTVWATETAFHGSGGMTPRAGPQTSIGPRGVNSGFNPPAGLTGTQSGIGAIGNANEGPPANFGGAVPGGELQVDSTLLQYLESQQGTTKFLVATENANTAGPIILATGQPVMALGGFTGSDSILTVDQLKALVANGEVRFFLLSGGGGMPGFTRQPAPNAVTGTGQNDIGLPGSPGGSNSLTNWVTTTCTGVPSSTWQANGSSQNSTPPDFRGGQQLYDCSTVNAGA